MPQLKVKIVGCGRMGRERARCAVAAGAEIVGVSDIDPARALALAKDYECGLFSQEDAIQDCDAVFLCNPPESRPSLAMHAIRCAVPFFAEKPISTTAIAAESVARALESSPVINAIGYMNRYRASIQYAVRLLPDRDVLGLTAHWVCRPYAVPWWTDQKISGGPLNEQGTHLFDLARYLCGEIEKVSVFASPLPGPAKAPLSTAVCLQFASGCVGTILYSCGAQDKDIGLRVITTAGSIAFSGWNFDLTDGANPAAASPAQPDVFLVETAAFLEAVRTRSTTGILSDWTDALRTQRVVEAANNVIA